MKLPLRITILTSTLNSNIPVFRKVMESVKFQDYPKSRIEHYILDGGSTNGLHEITKEYSCTLIVKKSLREEGRGRFWYGLTRAKGDLILILQSDNILTTRDWLRRMVEPFKEKKVFATYPMYNDYEKDMNITTRYTALLGSPDPTLYYLNKSDKVPVFQHTYTKGTIQKETRNYYVVTFDERSLPTVGDNGILVRKELLERVLTGKGRYLHTDAFADLLRQGYATYGVVKNSIIHVAPLSLYGQAIRRVEVKRKFTDALRGKRTYLVFNWNDYSDWVRLVLYVICALTFVQPLYISIRGFMAKRDIAWFVHPIMCILMVVGYGWSELRMQLANGKLEDA